MKSAFSLLCIVSIFSTASATNINMSPIISYLLDSSDAQPSIENTASLTLTPSAITEKSVTIISTIPMPLARHQYFRMSDVSLRTLVDGTYIQNRTNRKFNSLVSTFVDTNGNEVLTKLTFPFTLEAHTDYKIDAFTNSDTMKILDTQPLYNAKFIYKGKDCVLNADGNMTEDGKECIDTPNTAEIVILDTMLANIKVLYNSVHALSLMKTWAKGGVYGSRTYKKEDGCDKYSQCSNAQSTDNYIDKMFLRATVNNHKITLKANRYVYTASGWGGGSNPGYFGHKNGGGSASIWYNVILKNRYHTIHHEVGHGFGFSHASGFTYGISDKIQSWVNDYHDDKTVPIESAPKYVFTVKNIGENKLLVKLSNTLASSQTDYKIEILSALPLAATITKGTNSNEFIVQTAKTPDIRFLLRAYAQDAKQVMTQYIYPADMSTTILFETQDKSFAYVSHETWSKAISKVGEDLNLKASNAKSMCVGILGKDWTLAKREDVESVYYDHASSISGFSDKDFVGNNTLSDKYTLYNLNTTFSASTIGPNKVLDTTNVLCVKAH